MRRIASAVCLVLLGGGILLADTADDFFDDGAVREIRLYFDDPNWYNTLYQAHASNREDPYFPARFQYGDLVIDSIGARFKGNASFRRGGVKKSFKLDFNKYQEDATFLGLKKLNLHNADLEPDFLREKLFAEFASKFVPAIRSVHTRVYVNDVYWGLYIASEQVDKTMMEDRFGDDEDGNLFAAGEFNADLTYRGADAASYTNYYELQTNETANDYSDLIQFIDILNNTPTESLAEKLEPICDVENMLYGIALNLLFVNLDSYAGSGSEYYLYHRNDTGQFVHVHVDLNESFGTTGDGSPRIADPLTLDLFWLPTETTPTGPGGRPGGGDPIMGPGGPGMGGSRPLMEKLWAVDSYKRTYLRQLARMLREGFDPVTMEARINELADLIRADVYADPNKFFTNEQFETALTSQVNGGQTTLYGLLQFVRERYNYLRPVLDSYAAPSDVRLNELMASNSVVAKDSAGDYDPWIELHNLGPGQVNLTGFYLTDDVANPTKWALPERTLTDGEFLVLWLDGETAEGDNHASFRLQAGGGSLYLHYNSGTETKLIDEVAYPELGLDRAYIRMGTSGSRWTLSDQPTPGSVNPATGINPALEAVALRINEFMADNQGTVEDPDEPGAFDDWIEVYNADATAVDMSGMYLTDDLANPTKWKVPEGVTVPAGGHLLFWADGDPSQGSTHTSFQLAAGGEQVGLYHRDGATLIDSVTFETQQPDVSFGRYPDGSDNWASFSLATPGAANSSQSADWIVNAASLRPGPLAPSSIVAAFGESFATASASAAEWAPLPTVLAGTTVEVTDSAKITRTSSLFFVSPGQVNFQIPADAATGPAKVTIRRQDGGAVSGEILIDSVAPALFTANPGGQGAGLLGAMGPGSQIPVPLYTYDLVQQRSVAVPIALRPEGDQVYLMLYGTGIRGSLDRPVFTVAVGGEPVPIVSVTADGDCPGLDKVKVGPLPRRLAGRGEVEIEFRVDGRSANKVTVNFE